MALDAWTDLSIHQKILCPSWRLVNVIDLVRRVNQADFDPKLTAMEKLGISASATWCATNMIGAHSSRIFGWRARQEEVGFIDMWINHPDSSPPDFIWRGVPFLTKST